MVKSSSSRVARRRAADRQRILDAAAARIASAGGVHGVTVEDIGEDADIARRTLYSHFESKDAIIASIVRPVMDRAVDLLPAQAPADPDVALDAVVTCYLTLWREQRDSLRVAYCVKHAPDDQELMDQHEVFMRRLIACLKSVHDAGRLRCGDPMLATHTISRVYISLLELYADREGGERLFGDSLRALLAL